MMADHTELQKRLIQCALNDFFEGMWGRPGPACTNVSAWIAQAIRPAWRGQRTDVIVFGVCDEHKDDWRLMAQGYGDGKRGYEPSFLVEWSALGEVLEELDRWGKQPA